ncbi:MAG: DUF4380 domain-containing protein [Candidatus Omnitrophica bacterium]|nr:DUF4380 domain-containing protein [Candidatus Omnitrophota bacterium]
MGPKEVGGFKIKSFTLGSLVVGVATDIGPRILWLSSKERPDFNLFEVLPETGVKTPDGFWHIYGGHRLWTSPEAMPRSYSLDDQPVDISIKGKNVVISGKPELANSVRKAIRLTPREEGILEVVHTITNISRWPISLSAWALSVMRPDGTAIIPCRPAKVDDTGLLPDRHLTLWPYTDLSDRRFHFTQDYLFLAQDQKASSPVKIGTAARPDWAAYWVAGMGFVKTFQKKNGDYPDYGCTVEVYTNSQFLELETLSPLQVVEPGNFIVHTEFWRVKKVKGEGKSLEKLAREIETMVVR